MWQRKQQIVIFQELEPENIWHFAWKMTEIINKLSNVLQID